MISRSLVVLVTVSLVALRAHGYGPAGHEMVGTIAEGKLAGRSASKKARLLLGGVSLARAATLADDIKRWDGKTGLIDPHSLHLSNNPALERELFDFWQANPANTGKNPTLTGAAATMDPWTETAAQLSSITTLGYTYAGP